MADYPCYVMSVSQINDLWHYDNFLAHTLMDLPLRKCKATPSDLPEFERMNLPDFNTLKRQIRTMWIKASFLFKCKEGNHGWGLFAGDEFEQNKGMFTDSKPLVMGWLVRVPSPTQCPTGHRYLRSPCSTEEFPIYIGGPISLSNYDPVNRVLFKRCLSNNEPLLHKMGMYKSKSRKIVNGTEIVWNYNLGVDEGLDKTKFYPEKEWHLDICCSEGTTEHVSVSPDASVGGAQSSKRRKVGPCITDGEVNSHRYCTYCGVNLASDLDPGKKTNLKRHLALKHSAHLCSEMGADINSPDDAVCDKAFMKHLDKVDCIINSLKSHGYKVVPACNFFELNNEGMLPEEASPEEKDTLFHKFFNEARMAFFKYQVVYLKGITIPEDYEDLMKMDPVSNYADVNWLHKRPSGRNFSLNQYESTPEEDSEHALDIRSQFTSVVLGWM